MGTDRTQAMESSAMRQLLLVLLERVRQGVPRVLGWGLPLTSAALVVVGCASPSLMPETQAVAIKARERGLAPHAAAIHAEISQSATQGALAFLDTRDGRLVVLPGDSPGDAWARYIASPEPETGRASPPPVLTFVHRGDVPKAPEAVTLSALQQQRTSVAALEAELRDSHRRLEERLGLVQRDLAASIAAAKGDAEASVAARADLQRALSSLSEDLAAVRKFMLQTAQLGWLTHELSVESASGMRKLTAASQEMAASSAKLEETVRQLSVTLAAQLKQLASRLDTIQGKVSSLK
jgi:hypothetical protein